MRVVATGSYVHAADRDLPPLKELARSSSGASVRRVGRFVQLALLGAGRCVEDRSLPRDTAIYVTSCRGDLEITLEALVEMCENGRPPAPFAFINAVGNAAGFHLAKAFGVSGRCQFVTRRHAPLESVLSLAALDMAHGGVTSVLLGSIEMCTMPLEEHRARIGVAPGARVGEGSHWLLLARDPDLQAALGAIPCVASFEDEAELVRTLRERRLDPDDTLIAGGQHLPPGTLTGLVEATGLSRVFDYRSGLPWYDSQFGHGICRFLSDPSAGTLVHVDGDSGGRVVLVVVEAATGRA